MVSLLVNVCMEYCTSGNISWSGLDDLHPASTNTAAQAAKNDGFIQILNIVHDQTSAFGNAVIVAVCGS